MHGDEMVSARAYGNWLEEGMPDVRVLRLQPGKGVTTGSSMKRPGLGSLASVQFGCSAIARRVGRQSAAHARDTLVAIMLLASTGAWAQQPAPPGMGLAEASARRFPQPVRVGDLIGRTVLRPLESQPVLGHVKQVVWTGDGTVDVVLDYGGLLGFGGRLIAVPADAMVLLGAQMEVVDFTPKQLDGFATFNGSGVMAVPLQDSIRVGLARPSH